MKRLESVGGLAVSQRKEWGEILSGFEGRNTYVVCDAGGNELFYAVEETGSTFARIFLKAYRPFSIYVADAGGEILLRIQRPFRFYFPTAKIFDGSGKLVGSLERRFSVLQRIYSILSPNGKPLFELLGSVFHPWTFKILEDGRERGMIQKKWTGLLKEGFTDADNFGITFPSDWPVEWKTLALGTVLLIDFFHFENKSN